MKEIGYGRELCISLEFWDDHANRVEVEMQGDHADTLLLEVRTLMAGITDAATISPAFLRDAGFDVMQLEHHIDMRGRRLVTIEIGHTVPFLRTLR